MQQAWHILRWPVGAALVVMLDGCATVLVDADDVVPCREATIALEAIATAGATHPAKLRAVARASASLPAVDAKVVVLGLGGAVDDLQKVCHG